jgi:uncharacterized membrane protein
VQRDEERAEFFGGGHTFLRGESAGIEALMRRFRLIRAIRTGLWFTPLVCVLSGLVLAICTTLIDRHWGSFVPRGLTGTPRDVQQVLGTTATSIVTLMGLVLTMTLVVVQLAMGQFSSRIVRPLLENHPSQLVIGLFGATLVQAFITLRGVDVVEGRVPGLSVLVSYALFLVSLVMLVFYTHQIGITLRSSSLIDTAGDRGIKLVDDLFPASGETSTEDPVIASRTAGVVARLLRDRIVDAACKADCTLELVPMMGDFVPHDSPLFRIHGDDSRVDHKKVAELVILGDERALKEDLGAAMRALVDIADRALQQPFSDPTTAVQSIHRLHDLLRRLAQRPFPDGIHRDSDGVIRFVEPIRTWDGYVRLAFDEIRVAGAHSPQIPRRLRAALDDLKRVAPPERQAALDHQLRLLDEATPDVQGIGSSDEMVERASVISTS